MPKQDDAPSIQATTSSAEKLVASMSIRLPRHLAMLWFLFFCLVILVKSFSPYIAENQEDRNPNILQSADPPYYKDTTTPSFDPTSAPSGTPSMQPITILPTYSQNPTSRPTSFPSISPTIYVKTDFPTYLPSAPTFSPSIFIDTPTSSPSSFISPTSVPSLKPFPLPTSAPLNPSSFPTNHPAIRSESPSYYPSSHPSAEATPTGVIGRDWWYLITSEVKLFSSDEEIFSTYDVQEVVDALNHAFELEISLNALTPSEFDQTTVVVYDELSRRRLAESPAVFLLQKNASAEFKMKIWCPSSEISSKVLIYMRVLEANPSPILTLMQEDFREIESVQIESVRQSVTTTPPPSQDSNLAPTRIIYIIVGTVTIFFLGTVAIGCIRKLTDRQEKPFEDLDDNRNRPSSPQRSSQSRKSSSSSSKHRQTRYSDDGDILMTNRIVTNPMQLTFPGTETPSSQPDRYKSSSNNINNNGSRPMSSLDDIKDLNFDNLDIINLANDEEDDDYMLEAGYDHDEDEVGMIRTYSPNRKKSKQRTFRSMLSGFPGKKSGGSRVDYESLVI